MRCPKCGQALSGQKAFCKYCGEYLEQNEYKAAQPKNKSNIVVIAACVVAVVAVAAMIAVMVSGQTAKLEAALAENRNDNIVPAEEASATPEQIYVYVTPTPDSRDYYQQEPYYYNNPYYPQYTMYPYAGYDYIEQMILEGEHREYDISELYGMSEEEVGLIRNGMYALSGKIFNKEVNKEYFGSKSWYYPLAEDVLNFMSDTQKNNVEICVQYEKMMGWR